MKEKERMFDKNNITLRLEKITKKSIAENQMSRSRLAKKKSWQERGITLIALVVTIIILLILAGVTLNMALSQNGIFSKTQEAADKYKQAQEDEEFEIEKIEYAADGKDIKEVKEISTLEGFKSFRDDVNEGNKSFENTLIKLTDDIDLSEEDTWTPIGTADHPFNGAFNGNGHKIKNLKLGTVDDKYLGISERHYIGLFGINEGIIKNIGIESGSIKETLDKTYVVGMIAGITSGLIEGCYNMSNMEYESFVKSFGGIVGCTNTNGKITRCFNKGKMNLGSSDDTSGCKCVGGIVGYALGDRLIEISKCYNLGNITSYQHTVANSEAGGICGFGYINMESCYNVGDIKIINNKDEDNHTWPACGGLVGQLDDGKNYSIVKNCYNVGNVSVDTVKNNTQYRNRELNRSCS